jgi:hypothetical protein
MVDDRLAGLGQPREREFVCPVDGESFILMGFGGDPPTCSKHPQVRLVPRRRLPLDDNAQAEPRSKEGTPRAEPQQLNGDPLSVDVGAPEVSALTMVRTIAREIPEFIDRPLEALVAEIDEPAGSLLLTGREWAQRVSALCSGEEEIPLGSMDAKSPVMLAGLALLDSRVKEILEGAGILGPLLLGLDENVAAPGSRIWIERSSIRFAHGYRSDQPGISDELGISGDVNAVCDVITDSAVNPPIAIGLFGAWGSGKTFFMNSMRRRVAELTAGPGALRKLKVVQIRFNAWHYADTSLWASLAVEIFERLVDQEPVDEGERLEWLRRKGDPAAARRKTLMAELETYRQAQTVLATQSEELKDKRRLLLLNRKKAERARRDALHSATLTDIVTEVAQSAEAQDAIRSVLKELDVETTLTADEFRDLTSELHTLFGRATNTWKIVPRKGRAFVLAFAFTALALATTFLILALTSVPSLFVSSSTVCSALGAFLAGRKYIRPAFDQVQRAVKGVSEALATLSKVETRLRDQRTKDELKLQAEIEDHHAKIERINVALGGIDDKIASLEVETEALTSGRRLYDFLTDRAVGYQRHQGVVGMLHRDFRLLDAQLRAPHASDDSPGKMPQIDRVILYIDDLDRCPPAKVLEVLEAVHLLLALELFIVIVGVDPRWLKRSLRNEYQSLGSLSGGQIDSYVESMPTEYLEKIFQIPLTLPPMDATAYQRLVRSLTPHSLTVAPVSVPSAASTGDDANQAEPFPAARVPFEVEIGSAASGANPGQSVDLTPAEVAFAQCLSGLLETPRAAKRLVNTYRLIRSTRQVGYRSAFLGAASQPGEYQAALTLLAVAAGFPMLMDRFLMTLESGIAEGLTDWRSFVELLQSDIDSVADGPSWAELFQSPTPDESIRSARDWSRLVAGLVATVENNSLDDLLLYVKWGRTARRFSFAL